MILFLTILLFILAFFLGLTLGNAFEFDWQAYFDYKIKREMMAIEQENAQEKTQCSNIA